MDEEYDVCDSISKEDLLLYEQIVFDIELGNDVSDDINKLRKRGYGNDLKRIDLFFQRHLSNCFRCKEVYDDALNLDRETADPLSDILSGLYSEQQMAVMPEYKFLHSRFRLLHTDLEGISSGDLLSYIKDKHTFPEQTKNNNPYEEHVRKCEVCQRFDNLARVICTPK